MNDASEPASRYRAPALEKGLDIIELLANSPGGLSLTAVAGALGRSMGEIYRIAQALEARGYIGRDPESDQYALTLKLFELSHANPPTKRLLSSALPYMEKLAAQSQQSCHLAVLSGVNVLILAQSDAPRPMHYAVRLGAQFPLAETSSGAVLLAYQREDEQKTMLEAVRGSTPELARALPERLELVRRAGGERRPSLVVSGVINLSRPIFDHHGRILAALTLPYLEQTGLSVDVDGAERVLVDAANAISRELGWRAPSPSLTQGETP